VSGVHQREHPAESGGGSIGHGLLI